MMRRMTGGQGKGWRDARQKVMEAGPEEILMVPWSLYLVLSVHFISDQQCAR